jgi:hypothetical protein
MHHFRGKLLDGDQTRLDPANVYIQFHHTAAGGPVEGWNGYLLIAAESDVELGLTYTLTLGDGRSGNLRVDHLALDDTGKFRAFFVGEGPLQ